MRLKPKRRIVMELRTKSVSHQQKDYQIDAEMAAEAPYFHANHVQVTIAPDEVVIVFSTKVDSITSDQSSDKVVPQACVGMSTLQAIMLSGILQEGLDNMRREILERQAEAEKVLKGEGSADA